MSLTSPLGLMRHVRRPDMRLEVVPWLNVLAVAWMLTLLGGRFIYAPGIAIALAPEDQMLPARVNLPVVPGGILPGRPTDVVLTVNTTKPKPTFLLGSGIHYLADLPSPLRNARANLPRNRTPVLLFITDGDLPTETLLQVLDLARTAGFEVQIAAQSQPSPAASPAAGN